MEISINIVEIVPKNMGEEAELKIKISDNSNFENYEINKITVYSKMLFEYGNIGINSLPYTLTREQYDSIVYDGTIYEAVKKAMELLSFGDNTAATLIHKLRLRGFDKYICEDAVEYLVKGGYIDETAFLSRVVKKLCEVKLYGRMRIKSELAKKGFSKEIIKENLEELLSEVDFEENAYRMLLKKCNIDRLSDRKYRDSLYAAMYRYGYSPSETKEGIARLKANTD